MALSLGSGLGNAGKAKRFSEGFSAISPTLPLWDVIVIGVTQILVFISRVARCCFRGYEFEWDF